MYCKNCGKEVAPGAAVCLGCGVRVGDGNNFCQNCGAAVAPNAAVCVQCGYSLSSTYVAPGTEQKSKIAAGLLGIFLGGFGVHNFYLGFTGKAIVQIIVSIVTCGAGSIWGFIEGILILCGKIDRDAQGVPLSDK